MSQRPATFVLHGGLDLVTPALQVPPGFAIAAVNYESEARGYRRIGGYEAYDGQDKPSEISYSILGFDAGTAAISEGDTVTGATSGATGIALVDGVLESGSYGGSDAAGYLVLWSISGTFQDNENLQVSAATRCVADGTPVVNGATDDTNHSTWTQAAIEKQRALIAKPTGSGAVRGLHGYSASIFAFRDNAGGTALDMFKATTSGWATQNFGHTLDFSAGTTAFVEGETVTGGTSGATATVERIITQSGTWSGTAAGYVVLSGITGTFQASEALTGSTAGAATSDGTQVAITLTNGGTMRAINHNFYGTSNLKRMYFVTGEGYAHEWDGTVLAPIKVPGLTSSTDKPIWIAVHKNHIFLGYAGGAVLFSGTGLPLSFLAADGAGEIGFGEDLTGLLSFTSTSLVIFGRNRIGYLVGNDSSDFDLKTISGDTGAIAETAQVVGRPIFLDDRGIRDLNTVQAFGDWKTGSISQLVEPFFKNKQVVSSLPVGSLKVRAKDQYRIFFDDKSGMTIYFGRKNPECLPFELDFTPSALASTEDASGNEILLAGSSDGWVYEMDSGTSFDGAEISAYIRLPFNNLGSPSQSKRYHSIRLEIDGSADTNIAIAVEYSYGDPDLPAGSETAFSVRGGGGFWNESNWDEFYWSAAYQGIARAELAGIGTNLSPAILSDAIYEEPHTLSAYTVNYSPRRLMR